MAFNGGDVFEVTYNHPTIGDGVWYIKSGEETTFDAGGIRSEDDMGAVAGNGEMIKKMTRKRWKFEGPVAWDMNSANELAVMGQLAADPENAQFTISHINGTIWSGNGTVVGDIPGNGMDATIPLKLSGGGNLKKIA